MTSYGVCDFCSTSDPTWMFPARDFLTGFDTKLDVHGSFGAWAACDDCKAVVEEGIEPLVSRATERFIARHPGAPDAVVRAHLRQAYERFYANVTGPAVPIAEMVENCEHPGDRIIYSEHNVNSAFLPTGWYCGTCGDRIDTP